jgi:hypothetical protein
MLNAQEDWVTFFSKTERQATNAVIRKSACLSLKECEQYTIYFLIVRGILGCNLWRSIQDLEVSVQNLVRFGILW